MKMKILPLLIGGLLMSGLSFGQFHMGVKAGADINKIDGKSFKEEFSFGYQVGGFAQVKLSNRLTLQPEVLFSQVNIDTTNKLNDIYQFENISEVQLSYLKIPILLNYNVGKLVSLQVGPQFGILIDKNLNLFNNGKSAFKSGDFSMLAGVQLNLSNIHIYGRYGIGLSNLNDIDDRDEWKSQQIQVGIGLRIF